MRRWKLAVAVAAAVALGPASAEARDCPPAVDAQNAIVIETSTGDVACARRADQRRPVGSAVKLMTALLTLERAKLDEKFRASSYRPASYESQIGLLPRERMTVRDLLQGPAGRVRQRRGDGARRGRVRLRARVRQADEPPCQAARPDQHPVPQPDRARRAGRLLERPRPRQAGHLPAHQAVLPPHGRLRGRRAHVRRPPPPLRQPQHPRHHRALGQRRQDRPYAQRRLRTGRLRPSQRHPGRVSRARHAQRGRPQRRHAAPAHLRPPRLPAHHRRAAPQQRRRPRPDQIRPRRRARARGRAQRRAHRRPARRPRQRQSRPDQLPVRGRGPDRLRGGAGRGRRHAGRAQDRHRRTRRQPPRCPGPTWRSAPRPGSAGRSPSCSRSPS